MEKNVYYQPQMMEIIRKDIYLCSGDKRIIYTLPEEADEKFVSALASFGTLKKMDLGASFLWVIDYMGKMQLRLESGQKCLDARFNKMIFNEKIQLLENLLKAYYKADIRKTE